MSTQPQFPRKTYKQLEELCIHLTNEKEELARTVSKLSKELVQVLAWSESGSAAVALFPGALHSQPFRTTSSPT
jgi:hypothetical protein